VGESENLKTEIQERGNSPGRTLTTTATWSSYRRFTKRLKRTAANRIGQFGRTLKAVPFNTCWKPSLPKTGNELKTIGRAGFLIDGKEKNRTVSHPREKDNGGGATEVMDAEKRKTFKMLREGSRGKKRGMDNLKQGGYPPCRKGGGS